MLVNVEILSKMLLCVAGLWQNNTNLLSDIDSRFGDGDHGVTIAKIARAIETNVQERDGKSARELICSIGESILGISGGSAGPLYGIMIGGLAEPLGDESDIDSTMLKKMLMGSYDEMTMITKARVGDKTMMDALIPAVQAAQTASDSVSEVLRAAAKAASEGADSTKDIASKFGRARSYGEQTIGTQDAGAVSTSLFFQGLYEGLQSSVP